MSSVSKGRARRRRGGRSWLGRLSRTPAAYRIVAALARGGQAGMRLLGTRRGPAMASYVARKVAPLIPETRLALANLEAAFPEKSEAERRAIVTGVWDNLARTMAEMAMSADLAKEMDRFDVVGVEHMEKLRDDGMGGIVFTAHIANWEILAVLSARHGMPISALYRPPANPYLAADIEKQRSELMGPQLANTAGVATRLRSALKRGEHLGILVDQRAHAGLPVPFFGRPALTNRLVGTLVRGFECPVIGAHAVRLPAGRFRIEVTPPLVFARDAEGKVDVDAATHRITGIVEGWVRAHPEQWLWLHNRWLP